MLNTVIPNRDGLWSVIYNGCCVKCDCECQADAEYELDCLMADDDQCE